MSFNKLISWSEGKFNHLPWRVNRSLYRTWISEVMLQQTTVYTVKSRLDSFCEKFPDVTALSEAKEEDLLIAWKGLGYYSRAKNLKKAAVYLVENFSGEFPESIDELKLIPGIGPYTASAIYAIGQNKRALAVDANLERVLCRYYGIKSEKGDKLKKIIQQKFTDKEIISTKTKNWRGLNEAFMDLGREVCQSRSAYCELCKLRSGCTARSWDDPTSTPYVSEKKKTAKQNLSVLRVICEKDGKIFCYKKPKGTWLAGQYEIPTFVVDKKDEKINQYPFKKIKKMPEIFIKTGITKYKITNYILYINHSKISEFGDFELLDKSVACKKLSTTSLKCLETIQK